MKNTYFYLVIVLFINTQSVFSQSNCLSFDGTDDYVVANTTGFTEYSYEAWVMLNNNVNQNIIVYSDAASGPGSAYSNQLKTDASGHFVHYTFDGSGKSVVGTTVINTGQWYHVAITAKNGGVMRLYVNGFEEGTAVAISNLWTGNRLFLGSSSAGVNNLNGKLDEVRIWNTQRTLSQLQSNIDGCLESNESGLISYYKFENASGSATLSDITSNGYNGTLSNMNTTSAWVSSGFSCVPPGKAIDCGTSNAYVAISPVIPLSSAYTLEGWFVSPLPAITYCTMFRGSNLHHPVLTENNILGVFDNNTFSFISSGYNMASLSAGWHHIAASATGGTTTFYIDGNLVGSSAFQSNDNISSIGAFFGGGQSFGRTDEIRIWNFAKSQSQIQATMNTSVSPSSANLIAYYTFDNILNNIVFDKTSNNYNGTLTLGPTNPASTATVSSAPSITSFTPTSSGIGNTVTITGNNLTGATAVSFGGTAASSYTVVNSTAITAKVSSGTSGNVSVTTPSGTANSGGFTYLTAPGNKLQFDGSGSGQSDYVSIPDLNNSMDLQNTFTIESWIYLTDAVNNTIIDKGNYNYLFQTHSNGNTGLGLYNNTMGWIYSAGTIPSNQWVHVAVTFSTVANQVIFYLNGNVLSTHSGALNPVLDNADINIGRQSPSSCACNVMDGSIDELRVWNVVRTQAQIQASMNSTISGSTANLVAYYNMDVNSGTKLYDLTSNANNGSLINSPTWSESYSMVVPNTSAATSITNSSFTANWSAPTTGTVTNYVLDVSTSSNFSTFVSGYNGLNVGTSTSYSVTGLSANTAYYYRVRANKTSVANQGDYSSTINLTTLCPDLSISTTTGGSRCDAGTVNLSATAASGTVNWYSVSTGGTSLGTGTTFTTPVIPTTTTYYVESVGSSCTTATRTAVIATVYTTPSISVTTNGSRCDMGTVNLGATSSAGTINWYLAASGGSSLATGTSYTTPIISSTSTFYVDATANGCTTSSRTAVTATVTTTPSISTVTGAARCSTGTVNLSATSSAGTINWYAASTGGSSLGSGTTYTTSNISSTSTYYVDATLNSCTSANRTAVTATVNPLPTVSISGTTTICNGASTTLTASGANNYVWTSGPSTASYIVSPTSNTSYTVTGTETVNNCSNTAIVSITVNPLPTISISISQDSTCSGVTTTLTASGGNTYSWHHDASTGNAVSVSPTASTTYTVSGFNTFGCENTKSQYVMVYPSVPNRPGIISGPTTVCASSTGNVFSIVAMSNTASYSWTVPTGSTITSGQGTTSITVTLGTQGGNVGVMSVNPCGESSFITRTLTLQTTPLSITAISGLSKLCFNSTNNIYAVSGGSGATAYSWTVPSGATIVSGQGTSSVKVNFGTTSGNITVTPSNSCATGTTFSKAITLVSAINPTTPGSITGPDNICSYGTNPITYKIAAVTGAVSYSWAVPSGITISSGQGTVQIIVTASAGFTSGNLSVYAIGQCGTSSARTKAITKNVSVPASISGNTVLCGTLTYTATAVNNATSYTWTVPSGVTINSGQGTRTLNVTNSSGTILGNIAVAAVNACNTSAYKTKAIQGVPAMASSITGPITPCANSTGNLYTVPIVSGVSTYSWTAPSGATIVGGQGTRSINITYGATAGNVTVMSGNTCGYSGAKTKTISFGCRLAGEKDSFLNNEIESEYLKSEIYPNPFNESVFVNLTTDSYIEIIDINGAIVKSIQLKVGENELNTLDLTKGVYFVKVYNSSNNQEYFKIIKQ